ncbi:hypothetical protein [Microbacterium sp. Leaf436]|uniref:hypothetical protein n=1 Tax=Microbacterium sp. Leaf436 TaxID=1736377 RepID=UPI0006F888F1|nr:hypothetical protein [Microbacterium sp. Leaf436]KQT75396.1 hypothetical protein ASG45_02535 [Microbacterium sp. Leaf436]
MDIIRKDATIAATGTEGDFPGTFEVILSAPTLDRDGDTLKSEEWVQPLPEHITFDSDHGMSVATTVGSGVPRIDEKSGNLIVAGTYSSLPRAQEVRTLVNEGHIRTTSVAFMTLTEGKGAGAVTKRELLNGAFVAIPSNREAVVLTSKSATHKAGARNSAADGELIQAILDAAVSLGASLPSEKAFRARPGTKTLAGSLEAVQERARAALREANPGDWVWLRGTLPDADGGGTLVFEVEDRDTYESELYRQSYTDDGSVITLQGERSTVGVVEVLTPDPDSKSMTPPADAGADGKAPAPADDAPAADDAEQAELQVRMARIRALNTLAGTNSQEGK